jgi:Protein of unknown function (DUF3105)
MASRQQEKERRRQERLERERKEQAATRRKRRLQLVSAVVAGIAVVAAIGVFAFGGGGGDGGDGGGDGPSQASSTSDVNLPEQQTSDMADAAKAAGCKLTNPAYEGNTHSTKEFAASDYKTNPPTSGAHNPEWYEDGVYEPGTTPELGKLVHPLEHGRIEVQYKKGTPEQTVRQLEALLAEQSDGYHMLLFENTTNMDAAVAATAWTHSLTCAEMNDKVFDAIRTFRARYIDKGPEKVP